MTVHSELPEQDLHQEQEMIHDVEIDQEQEDDEVEASKSDSIVLEFDDIDDLDPLEDAEIEKRLANLKPNKNTGTRKSIEDILAERELSRQLKDIFSEELEEMLD